MRNNLTLGLCLLLAACGPSAGAVGTAIAQTQAAQPKVTDTAQVFPTLPPEWTATPAETATPASTRTPRPTATVGPTNTPRPTSTPRDTATATAEPVGTITVDSWKLEIFAVVSDPGINETRQTVVLLINLTNEGTQTDTYVPFASIVLVDSQGRIFEDDQVASFAAQDKYGAEYGASMSPGATAFIVVGFDVPASEKSFTIEPGSLVSGWSGNLSFTLP